jgi:NodT family efflux transporter outer membrane factor (OMF) lipoprotein
MNVGVLRNETTHPMNVRRISICALRALTTVLLLLIVVGCTVGPKYYPPDLSATTAQPWQAASLDAGTGRIGTQAGPVAAWWQQFGDKELTRLVTELTRQNLTLEEARQRVVAVRAIRGEISSERWPQLDATAAAGSAGTGREGVNFNGPPPGVEKNVYEAGLSAAWELDLWGRVARLTHAADANVEIAMEDYHDAAVSLAAELATAYMDLRTLRARMDVLDQNIKLQRKALALAESELDAGSGSKLDVAQAQSQLSQTLAMRPALRDASARFENRIAVLLGRRPGANLIAPGGIPQMPKILGLGLPAELIERRADVRRAIAAYRGAVELVGAAKAERYPAFTLTGTLNVQSTDTANLFGGHAFAYNFGPSLSLPLFAGGRIDATIHERIARVEERRAAAERTLLEAIGEVENAAVGVARGEERQQDLTDAALAARNVVDMTEHLYRSGLADMSQVIAATRAFMDLEDKRLQAQRDALVESVRLYRALGGGWQELPQNATPRAAVTNAATAGAKQTLETRP